MTTPCNSFIGLVEELTGQMKENLIANHYINATISGAVKQGISATVLLQQAGIPCELRGQPQARITDTQLTQLVKAVWRATGDEFLGFTAHRCKNGVFALMAESVLQAHTLGAVLQQCARFYQVVRDDLDVALIHHGGEVEFQISLKQPDLDTDHLLQEFLLLMFQRFCCWLVGQQLAIVKTNFNYAPPAHVDEYRLMFGDQLVFDAQISGFYMSKRLLKLPVVREPKSLHAFLIASPAGILRRPQLDETYQTQIRKLIIESGVGAPPCLDTLAETLHVTTRTLRRKLKEEGATYRQILDGLRCDMAIQLLTEETLSIAVVSQRIGFAEPAAFCRAFKRWMGVAPSLYQRTGD